MGRSVKDRRELPKYVVEYKVGGKPYIYFRRKGQKDVRMHGTPYSEEWLALYHLLLSGVTVTEVTSPALSQPAENTLGWLCQKYFAGSEFGELDKRTQHVRRLVIQSCLDEPVKEGGNKIFAEMPLRSVSPKAVGVLRDRKRDKPEAANGRVKALRAVFKWACLADVGLAQTNPARDVAYRKSNNPSGFHTWTLDEVEQYEARHPIGTKARLAMAICLYTFQRRSDVHRVGPAHIKAGKLVFTQFKGRNRDNPVHMEIPILPELRQILDATETGDMVWLLNDLGRPFTAAGFGNKMRQWCDQAGLPQCSAHGLRKAACVRMAMNGATPHEIMAWSGHKTLREVERYTREAEKRKLAMASVAKAGNAS